MKKFWTIAALSLLLPAAALAQDEAPVAFSGSVTAGVQQVTVDNNSAKFDEYRDLQNGFNLYDLSFFGIDTAKGNYVELSGKNLVRDDQDLRFGLGSAGTWRLSVENNKIPHNLSNKAMTPFIDRGNGVYTVPSPVLSTPINGYPNAAANTATVLATDDATAAWLSTNLHATELGTQRDKTSATLQLTPTEALKFRLTYSDDRKDGSKITYGPIGARPPDSLNIQMAEPINYVTRELKFETEYNLEKFQSLFSYTLSDFENETDTLTWQNIWAYNADVNDPSLYMTSDSGTRYIGTFGARALAPDNRYQNATLSLGFDLPLASRLAATLAYGKMEQDEDLIPYSTSAFGSPTPFNSTTALARTSAEAEIETKLLNLDYTINPISRLNLRAFYRYYDLDNSTPNDDWRYVTNDTIVNTQAASGLAPYKNQRTNLAYDYNQQNYGLDASYGLAFWRTTLGLGYEREAIERDNREANTEEDMLKASLRTRPADWLSLRAKVLYGEREADGYNSNVTANSYWYTTGTDNDDPKYTFSNHPDMRKFDVTDRERQQLDLAATVTPVERLDLTASYRWRNDDYESGVKPTQPLLNYAGAAALTVANQTAWTPGDQLGLLESETERIALDASYAPSERLTLTAFASQEDIESTQRGLEFNENNKVNPSGVSSVNDVPAGVSTADLGPWTRANSQWLAKTEDTTYTVGAGLGYELVPGKLNFVTDITLARGEVDIAYSGFGVVSSFDPTVTLADNNQYAFRSPPTIKHNQQTLNASLEYQVVTNLIFGFHYLFDRYRISDWSQEANTPWAESVGSEYLLRDTSDSYQWGNRLVNMGSNLSPDYDAHMAYLSMTYKF